MTVLEKIIIGLAFWQLSIYTSLNFQELQAELQANQKYNILYYTVLFNFLFAYISQNILSFPLI